MNVEASRDWLFVWAAGRTSGLYLINRSLVSTQKTRYYLCGMMLALPLPSCFYLIVLTFECHLFLLLGCQVIAPSDMMDNRIGAIKQKLQENKLAGVSPITLCYLSLMSPMSSFQAMLKGRPFSVF